MRNRRADVVLLPQGVQDPSALASPPAPHAPPLTFAGLNRALGVTDKAVDDFQPTPEVLKVGEAILAGHAAVEKLMEYTGLERDAVKGVLNDAVAMQWISRRTESLFRSRAAVVDCALYLRAAAGDTRAIDLFYRRMKLLEESTKKVEVTYSGGVNLTAIADGDLQRLIQEKIRTLPADFKVKDVECQPTEPNSNSSTTPPAN